MEINFSVKIGKLKLKNPVMVASGTFGYGEEFEKFLPLKELGAIITKTITLKPRNGNPPCRITETPCGVLNSIGLENPGLEGFIKEKLTKLKKIGTPIIVSVASEKKPEEFFVLVKELDKLKEVSAIELNLSCPNIRAKKNNFLSSELISQDPDLTYNLLKKIRKFTNKTLIAKLSPNVTDITKIALAVEGAQIDAVSLVNTFLAMSINVENRTPKLSTITGGLSGPAIRPIALRMVWEVYQKVKIPIIGMGGIVDTYSALEFFIVGATAIAIGTANFINPRISIEIIKGLKSYLVKNKFKSISNLIGSLNAN